MDKHVKYREKHRARLRLRSKLWAEKNPEKVAATKATWGAVNLDKGRIRCRKWRVNNKEKSNSIFRLNCANRRIKCFDKLSDGLVDRLLILQKGKCTCCGVDIVNTYHVDHIMPLSLGGRNEDSNIQLLSPSCNLSKRAKHPIDYMQSKGLLV